MNFFKRLHLISIYIQKLKAKWHLEQDIAFLTTQNDKIMDKSEDELREEMAELKKRISKYAQSNPEKANKLAVKAVEVERQINKYDSIKKTYGQSSDQLMLLKKYMDFLKDCILGKIKYELGEEKIKEEDVESYNQLG